MDSVRDASYLTKHALWDWYASSEDHSLVAVKMAVKINLAVCFQATVSFGKWIVSKE